MYGDDIENFEEDSEPERRSRMDDGIVDDEPQAVKPKLASNEKPERCIRHLAEGHTSLSKEDELEAVLLSKKGSSGATSKLLLHATKQLVQLVDRHGGQKARTDFAELFHEAVIAYLKAIDKFDPTLGTRLITYAKFWVIRAISKFIKSGLLNYPIHVNRNIRKVLHTTEKLRHELGRDPQVREIAQTVGLSILTVTQILRLSEMQEVIWLDENIEAANSIPDPAFLQIRFKADDETLADAVRTAFCSLEQRQRDVMNLRLGLTDSQEMTFAVIGNRINVSESRARRIYFQAEVKMVLQLSEILNDPSIAKAYFARKAAERKKRRHKH